MIKEDCQECGIMFYSDEPANVCPDCAAEQWQEWLKQPKEE